MMMMKFLLLNYLFFSTLQCVLLPNLRNTETFIVIEIEEKRTLQVCFKTVCSQKYENIIPHQDIPNDLLKFIVYQEDQRFFKHWGFNFREILVSLKDTIVWGARLRGASTITQQLARNLFLTQERTFKRKWHELQIAILLERQFSKQKILEMYINTTYWGHAQTSVSSAATFYFGKPLSDLSVVDYAFLVSLLPRAGDCLHWKNCSDRRIKIRMTRLLTHFYKKEI